MNKITIAYKASGIVYGNLWGGGRGAYPAEVLNHSDINGMREQILNGIREGWLDSGMGFDGLIGSLMNICTIETVEIDGKEFVNKEYNIEYFGSLDEKTKDYLYEVYLNI